MNALLEKTWSDPPGIAGWFSAINHKTIGRRYIVTAFGFFVAAGLLVSMEIIPPVFKMRAPGMPLARLPLFVWAMLVTAFMILFAMPAVMFASTALILDRLVGTHFYNPAEGGDPVLWQHLFWFF